MSRKQRISKRLQTGSVREARAGLIPQSDGILDEIEARLDRTSCIAKVVGRYWAASDSEQEAITSILVDLRHHCTAKRLSFSLLQAAAARQFCEETSSESEYLWTLGLENINDAGRVRA